VPTWLIGLDRLAHSKEGFRRLAVPIERKAAHRLSSLRPPDSEGMSLNQF
jgi:hypothetical protein